MESFLCIFQKVCYPESLEFFLRWDNPQSINPQLTKKILGMNKSLNRWINDFKTVIFIYVWYLFIFRLYIDATKRVDITTLKARGGSRNFLVGGEALEKMEKITSRAVVRAKMMIFLKVLKHILKKLKKICIGLDKNFLVPPPPKSIPEQLRVFFILKHSLAWSTVSKAFVQSSKHPNTEIYKV